MNKIYVVGIGPGGCDQMTGIAMNALKDSDTIIGYTVYVDLVKDTFPDKEYLTTPMKKEVDRCVLAFEEAMKGKRVSMICSGDAGVYGMAGLMYEVGDKISGSRTGDRSGCNSRTWRSGSPWCTADP